MDSMTRVAPETIAVKLLKARFVTLFCWILPTGMACAGLLLDIVFTPLDKLTPIPAPAATMSALAPKPLIMSYPHL